ncbi:hypothetical protein [Streptomyces sp. NPDC051662]|uniref:hypothetical protein n=1 Tax=Streptomyces sp. NPDC051662 TaxID=3154750 RepID=UPI00342B9F79
MTTENDGAGESSTTPKTMGNPSDTPPVTPPASPTLEAVTADRDRWKALSRQNESNYNTTRTELQQLQAAQERAVETARIEGRTSALGEVSTELVTAELQLQALRAGADLPDLSYLDLNRFAGDDSRPDADAVRAFVESLPTKASGSEFPHLAGAGHNRGTSGDFSSNDPTELADFIAGGSFL